MEKIIESKTVTIELTLQEFSMLQDAIECYRENIVACIEDGVDVDENRALLKTTNEDICPKFDMRPCHECLESDDNECLESDDNDNEAMEED